MDNSKITMTTEQKWKLPFLLIVIGQSISLIGSSAVQFALIWWITSETNSALLLGLSGMVAYVPVVLFSPAAGVIADRYNRKVICICADLFVGLSAAVFAFLLWLYEMPIWISLLVLLMRAIGNTFHSPSIRSIIPQMVPAEQLVRANSWNQMMQSGSYILGPILGAAMYAAFPINAILLTDLMGAIVACCLLGVVKVPKLIAKNKVKQSFKDDFKEGLSVYAADRKLLVIIIAETLCLIFYMPLTTFFPLMISSYFNAGAWYASAGSLSCALGMMASAILLSSRLRVKNKLKTAYVGLGVMGIAVLFCGLLPSSLIACWLFIFACAFIGGGGNIHTIPLTAYMHETISREKMGRAFSLLSVTSSVTMPIGLAIASPVAEIIGISKWFFISGIGICLITSIALLFQKKIKWDF